MTHSPPGPRRGRGWIDTFIGTRARHFSFDLDTGKIQYTLADLGTEAGRRALVAGAFRTALVLGGDSCTKHIDPDVDLRRMPPAQMVNYVLFGDGAGVAVLSREPPRGAPAIRHTRVRLRGLNRPPGQVVECFGAADRDTDRPSFAEDYQAISDAVPVMARETFGALPFFPLERLLPSMTSGDRALAVAIESSKWIQAGFALEKA